MEIKLCARSIENAATHPAAASIAGLVISNRAVRYIRDAAIENATTIADDPIAADCAVDSVNVPLFLMPPVLARLTMLSVSVAVPLLKMPPRLRLPLTVLLISVAVPLLAMPPVLARLTMLSVSVNVPPLLMPLPKIPAPRIVTPLRFSANPLLIPKTRLSTPPLMMVVDAPPPVMVRFPPIISELSGKLMESW